MRERNLPCFGWIFVTVLEDCAEGESERESAELWNRYSWEEKETETFWDPTLEKEEGFHFQTSQGMNGTHPEEKNISQMQCKTNDINFDEGFTAIKAQENKPTKEREMHTHIIIHSHAILRACIRFNAVLW